MIWKLIEVHVRIISYLSEVYTIHVYCLRHLYSVYYTYIRIQARVELLNSHLGTIPLGGLRGLMRYALAAFSLSFLTAMEHPNKGNDKAATIDFLMDNWHYQELEALRLEYANISAALQMTEDSLRISQENLRISSNHAIAMSIRLTRLNTLYNISTSQMTTARVYVDELENIIHEWFTHDLEARREHRELIRFPDLDSPSSESDVTERYSWDTTPPGNLTHEDIEVMDAWLDEHEEE